jgi:hypothetical protein
MAEGYKKIFWGIVIATFNITLGVIKVLPTFIGWIVVLTGLLELEKNNSGEAFSSSKKATKILAAMSFGGMFLSFLGNGNVESFLPLMFYPLFVVVIELVVFHKILAASVHHFSELNQHKTASIYISKDRMYLIIMGISLVFLVISLTFNQATMGIVGAILAILSRVYLLTIMSALGKEEHTAKDNAFI